jgi:anti-anti-sigma factor
MNELDHDELVNLNRYADPDRQPVCLDLGAIHFLNGKDIRQILEIRGQVTKKGRDFYLINPSPQVHALLNACRLDRVLLRPFASSPQLGAES